MSRAQLQPRAGDRIEVRINFGSGPMISARVLGIGEKNGRPLVDLLTPAGETIWAYFNQIDHIYPRESVQ